MKKLIFFTSLILSIWTVETGFSLEQKLFGSKESPLGSTKNLELGYAMPMSQIANPEELTGKITNYDPNIAIPFPTYIGYFSDIANFSDFIVIQWKVSFSLLEWVGPFSDYTSNLHLDAGIRFLIPIGKFFFITAEAAVAVLATGLSDELNPIGWSAAGGLEYHISVGKKDKILAELGEIGDEHLDRIVIGISSRFYSLNNNMFLSLTPYLGYRF